MIIRICAFTEAGRKLAGTIENALTEHIFEERAAGEEMKKWVQTSFAMKAPVIFIGAVGIAVRSVAPFVNDKLCDSPVIVIDEAGKYVIPVLSGHVGGANRLSERIAQQLGAEAVITTATDVRGLFSVDVFAVDNGLKIVNREGIQKVSAKLLAGESVTLAAEPGIEIEESSKQYIKPVPYDFGYADIVISRSADLPVSNNYPCREGLYLKPREYVLGIGCKKGTKEEVIRRHVEKVLSENDLSLEDIAEIATIDLKQKEYGLVLFAQKEKIRLTTYTAEELAKVEGDFSGSDFVKNVTGVDNICERAAVLTSQGAFRLVVRKSCGDGVTAAVARRSLRLRF